jgi:hypothetical protein
MLSFIALMMLALDRNASEAAVARAMLFLPPLVAEPAVRRW